MPSNAEAKTLVEKIWRRHVITELSDGRTLLHVDRHFLHDGTSRQAFDGMRRIQRKVRNPSLSFAVVDHIVSTLPGRTGESHPPGRERIHALRDNCREFELELYDVDSPHQGIAHVIAPELGIALPGCTLVCGDSHTATNGGLGALAWGIGTTEVMHVIAAQALLQRKPQQMRISLAPHSSMRRSRSSRSISSTAWSTGSTAGPGRSSCPGNGAWRYWKVWTKST